MIIRYVKLNILFFETNDTVRLSISSKTNDEFESNFWYLVKSNFWYLVKYDKLNFIEFSPGRSHTLVTYSEWHISPKIVSLTENLLQFFLQWDTFPPNHVSLRENCIKFTVDIPWVTQFWAEKSVSPRENFKRWCLSYLFWMQMKPIHEFNNFLKKQIGNLP